MTVVTAQKYCRECAVKKEKQRQKVVREKLSTAIAGHRTKTASHRTGAMAERLFDAMAIRKGWSVCVPVGDGHPGWDRVAVTPEGTRRVQIKGFSKNPGANLNRREKPYSRDAFDDVAVVDVATGYMWVIPWDIGCAIVHFSPANWNQYRLHTLWDEESDG